MFSFDPSLPQKYPKNVKSSKNNKILSKNELEVKILKEYLKKNYKSLRGLRPAIFLYWDAQIQYILDDYDRLFYKYK